jgi:hypothetical protein
MPTSPSLETRVEQLEARVEILTRLLDVASRQIVTICDLGLQKLIGPELEKLLQQPAAPADDPPPAKPNPKPKRSRKPRS